MKQEVCFLVFVIHPVYGPQRALYEHLLNQRIHEKALHIATDFTVSPVLSACFCSLETQLVSWEYCWGVTEIKKGQWQSWLRKGKEPRRGTYAMIGTVIFTTVL